MHYFAAGFIGTLLLPGGEHIGSVVQLLLACYWLGGVLIVYWFPISIALVYKSSDILIPPKQKCLVHFRAKNQQQLII